MSLSNGKKKSSKLWEFFTRCSDKQEAKCGLCGRIMSFAGGSSGNLLRHLRKKHGGVIVEELSDNGAVQSVSEDTRMTNAEIKEFIVFREMQKKKSKGRTSSAWQHFTVVTDKSVQCNYCKRSFSIYGGSTGNLFRHLNNKHSFVGIKVVNNMEDIDRDQEVYSDAENVMKAIDDPEIGEITVEMEPDGNDVSGEIYHHSSALENEKNVDPDRLVGSDGQEDLSSSLLIMNESEKKRLCVPDSSVYHKRVRKDLPVKDEYEVFGDFVASEIRSVCGLKNRHLLKKKIQDIIFEMKMKCLEEESVERQMKIEL